MATANSQCVEKWKEHRTQQRFTSAQHAKLNHALQSSMICSKMPSIMSLTGRLVHVADVAGSRKMM